MASDKLLLLVDRQFLQHARRIAPGRREARSAFRAGFAKSRRARAGDGAWFAASSPYAAVAGCGRAARRRQEHPARRFARKFRRTCARRCVPLAREHVARPIELHFFSDMQKSDMPASFAEVALPANVSLVLHPVVKSDVPNWTVESVNAPGQVWDPKKARVQAVIAGFGTPAATRTVSLVVNGKTAATRSVDVPAEWPRHRRIPVARRALRLQPMRSAHRFGGRFSRRRREPVRRRALRSATRPVRSRSRRLAFAALFPLGPGGGRGIGLHARQRSPSTRPPTCSRRITRSSFFRT